MRVTLLRRVTTRRLLSAVRCARPWRFAESVAMNADERFLFDLNGFIVVKDVLDPDVVAQANAAVDAHHADAVVAEHMKDKEESTGPPTARWDLRGMLGWEDRAPFVEMLAHPKLVRFVNEICGAGFRMDQ